MPFPDLTNWKIEVFSRDEAGKPLHEEEDKPETNPGAVIGEALQTLQETFTETKGHTTVVRAVCEEKQGAITGRFVFEFVIQGEKRKDPAIQTAEERIAQAMHDLTDFKIPSHCPTCGDLNLGGGNPLCVECWRDCGRKHRNAVGNAYELGAGVGSKRYRDAVLLASIGAAEIRQKRKEMGGRMNARS